VTTTTGWSQSQSHNHITEIKDFETENIIQYYYSIFIKTTKQSPQSLYFLGKS